MPVDYLQALKSFSAAGGTDINQFLQQHTTPAQTTPGPTVAPSTPPVAAATPPAPAVQTPPNALGSAPIAPAPIASDTVAPAPAAMASMTPPPPAAAPVATPPVPAPAAAPADYSSTANVVRQAARTNDSPAPAGGAAQIASRTLYPPVAEQSRMLGTGSEGAATPADRARFDRSFGFTPSAPVTSSPRAPAARKDAYDIGPYAEDSTGTFASGWKPPTPTASALRTSTSTGGQRMMAEADTPPGAQEWSGGPLANPKPTPPPRPSAVAALPRRRNQNAFATTVPRIFAGA